MPSFAIPIHNDEMISEGAAFPGFSLLDQDGDSTTLADILETHTVVFFYPKDDTSGCTAEACSFQATFPNIDGARVVGVSPDGVKSHRKFADKYGLTYTLLADTEHELCLACGVWVEKSMYGKKYMGVERTTFILNGQGIVTKIFNKVKPQDHAAEVLAALK